MASVSTDLGLPSLSDASGTAKRWGGWAIGMGTPSQQILANIVIFFVALVSSTVTLGATLLIALFAMFFGGIGVVRLIPVVNAFWPLG
jgi:hypothetical protein